jgi:tRNA threonylcarbamoyladenosine biosynthesis protein TsaB
VTVLAIDTTTEACSAALHHDGRTVKRFEIAPRQHAVLLMPMIDELLAEADCSKSDIEWVAFGRGPGAFTGVRIATGIAHGLSLGLGCGLVPVSTLEALAFGMWLDEEMPATVISCLDARMGEVYWAGYEIGDELPEVIVKESVAPPTAVTGVDADPGRVIGVGHGWSAHPEALVKSLGYRPGRIEAERFPDAAVMLELARRRVNAGLAPMKAVEAQPVYLRDRVATPPKG